MVHLSCSSDLSRGNVNHFLWEIIPHSKAKFLAPPIDYPRILYFSISLWVPGQDPREKKEIVLRERITMRKIKLNKIKYTIFTYFFHVNWLQGPKVRKVFAMVNQFSAVDENMCWKVKLPQFKVKLHHLLTEKCWVRYSTFLSFNFIVYKMEIMVAPTWNRSDWLTTQHLLSTYHESLLKKAKDGSEENETRRKSEPLCFLWGLT